MRGRKHPAEKVFEEIKCKNLPSLVKTKFNRFKKPSQSQSKTKQWDETKTKNNWIDWKRRPKDTKQRLKQYLAELSLGKMKEQKGHTKNQITDRAKDWHLTVNPRGKKGKVITSEDKDDTICILTKNGTENLNIYIQIHTTK